LCKLVSKVCYPLTHQGQRYRALRPWSAEDAFRAIVADQNR
jgi:hypothetical protein